MSDTFADFARRQRQRAWTCLWKGDLLRAWKRWRAARAMDEIGRIEKMLDGRR